MPDTVDAILLASGFSRRFGTNKLLAPFRGKALARHTIDLVLGMNAFGKVWFVASDPQVIALAEGTEGIAVVENPHPERGQRESIRLGLERSGADYFMFFPCDQGLLDVQTVRRILAAREPGKICRPECRGKPGAPVLFASRFREALPSLGEGERGRDIILRNESALVRIEIPDPTPLIDFDTPETMLRFL